MKLRCKRPYHTHFDKKLVIEKELDFYEKDGSMVFTHNLLDGYTPLFAVAKAIYSDLSWKQGYKKFMKEANKPVGDYKDYLKNVKKVIHKLKIPTFLVTGKHAIRILQPEHTQEIYIHGYKALLCTWYTEPIKEELKENHEASRFVSSKYDMILNFCCGYGNTAADALEFNNNFICSDVNGKCVYFVAKEYMGYEDGN